MSHAASMMGMLTWVDAPSILAAVGAALLLFLLCLLYSHFVSTPLSILRQLKAQGIPGPPFLPVLGQLGDLLSWQWARDRDTELASSTLSTEAFRAWSRAHGRVCSFALGPSVGVMLGDPLLARQAYACNGSLGKLEVMQRSPLLGKGLLATHGASWQRQRRLLNPAFSQREVRRMHPTMLACAGEALAKLESRVRANPDSPVEMGSVLCSLTLDIICRSAFGSQVGDILGEQGLGELMASFADCIRSSLQVAQLSQLLPWFKFLPCALNRRFWRAVGVIKRATRTVVSIRMEQYQEKIKEREKQEEEEEEEGVTDLLELMMQSTEGLGEGGEGGKEPPLDLNLLMANSVTFLLAGHETTATLLTWTMLMLSQHPEWQERARAEVDVLFAAHGGRTPPLEQLGGLKTLEWVLQETLRLYPPVPAMWRRALEATSISDSLTLPRGCYTLIPIASIHRDPTLWGQDAEKFRPRRWEKREHPRGAFLPFSTGARTCIGQGFAMAEARTLLALLLRRLSWELDPSYVHHPEYAGTTQARFGMPLRIEIREEVGVDTVTC